jgi:UDP-2-acetamido-2,6-beta-L-arabino-hexul-4-ose reductase
MKVLVTGSNGFIGKNLISHLREIEDVDIITFDRDDDFSVIENNAESIDFIFHLAGVNRPTDKTEFYKGNTELTKSIIEVLKAHDLKTPILITSSIQAVKDNDYGISKKMAEDEVLSYGKKAKSYVFRLHNVFGKWCRPNYNSVVATFCYNIAHDLEITINDVNAELQLVYIDDVVKEFIKILKGVSPTNVDNEYCYITPVYKTTLGDLANMIKEFKNNMNSITVPQTGDEFTKKLFATYVSYLELPKMEFTPKMNTDDRGSFTELVRTIESGQFSVSVSKPGIFRGNHYHHTKMERFIVAKGKARISFRHINEKEVFNFDVDDSELKIITIPVGYTHKIENIGNDDMILLLWCNELFDKENPDTYYCEV